VEKGFIQTRIDRVFHELRITNEQRIGDRNTDPPPHVQLHGKLAATMRGDRTTSASRERCWADGVILSECISPATIRYPVLDDQGSAELGNATCELGCMEMRWWPMGHAWRADACRTERWAPNVS
jgi:hypothetical protein